MAAEWQARVADALGNRWMRANTRRALDGLAAKRRAAFPDRDELERLRDQG